MTSTSPTSIRIYKSGDTYDAPTLDTEQPRATIPDVIRAGDTVAVPLRHSLSARFWARVWCRTLPEYEEYVICPATTGPIDAAPANGLIDRRIMSNDARYCWMA